MMFSDPFLILLTGCASGLFAGFMGLTCTMVYIFRNPNWYKIAPEFLKKSPIYLIFVVNGFLIIAMVLGIFFVIFYSFLGLIGFLLLLLVLMALTHIFLYFFSVTVSSMIVISLFLIYSVYGLLIPVLIELSLNS